ncbi:MAG TPA: MotA/TolQ/ExbB proton channel family protein [Planctomycetaceae bacterium]|nr:MotA/TolQ/ExbB proton channel family protein [Planctomycetaceae bacterium]
MIVLLLAGRASPAAPPASPGQPAAAESPPIQPDSTEAGPVPAAPPATDGGSGSDARLPPTRGIPTNPTGIILQLRWWIVPFVIASIIAVWFAIERLVVLRRSRVIPRPFVERFLQHLEQGLLDPDSALELCEQNGSPVAAVFAHGIRKWGKPSVEVEQAIIDGGERQISQLRKHLRVLNGVATVTPLLGLLGTVVGMIKAFNDIAVAGAMGRPDQLAVGIAIALLTTAFGLAIAIPALIMYMYLAGRVDTLVSEMDFLAQNVVQLISAEALAGGAGPATQKSAGKAPPSSGSKKAV